MTNDAPIGMFDSGIGGLTIAKALLERLPRESLRYVGDTAHMPYGDKSPERLRAYSMGIAERLLNQGCKMLVIACNSASSNALDEVQTFWVQTSPSSTWCSPSWMRPRCIIPASCRSGPVPRCKVACTSDFSLPKG